MLGRGLLFQHRVCSFGILVQRTYPALTSQPVHTLIKHANTAAMSSPTASSSAANNDKKRSVSPTASNAASSGTAAAAAASPSAKKVKTDETAQGLDEDPAGWDEEALIAAAEEAEQESNGASSQSAPSQPQASQTMPAKKTTTPSPSSTSLMAPSDSDPLALERATMSPAWFEALQSEFTKPYFRELKAFLASEAKSQGKNNIFPPEHLVHSWSNLTPRLEDVQVVIVGQDPYHGPGQAHGLCFSVPKGVPVPGSLRNIYKELSDEYPSGSNRAFTPPKHGNLEGWAKQGVLMLNSSLTVRRGQAASHANRGWEKFTRAVLKLVIDQARGGDSSGGGGSSNGDAGANAKQAIKGTKLGAMFQKQAQKAGGGGEDAKSTGEAASADAKPANGGGPDKSTSTASKKPTVFLVWGLPASKTLAEAGLSSTSSSPNSILLLKSTHPSPLSAHRGFLGNGHFKKADEWLKEKGREGVDWRRL
ncbi:unnamed protein product [Jaminaea pallidilutea]